FETGSDSIVGDIDGVKVALLICEDIWEDAPAADAAEGGAELLLVINASPYYVGQSESRERLLSRRARENRVAIAYVNCVGGQDDLLFDGGSLLIESDGKVAARAPQFVEQLLFAGYDNETRRFMVDWPQRSDTSAEAVLYAGLVTGVRDYVTKNHFPGVLLGLSGGIDSALTLAIAVDALGADKVTAVMLPTRYTSDLSLREAKSQANRLGVDYHVIAIESAFETMRESLQPIFEGRAEDTTEENMQARIRGVLLMALSNKFGRMVLTTGNKSEMAVGYCTLYGDMCGGFAPLKDVYKTMVWSLSRWRNARDGAGADDWVIPAVVIDRPPSAELRDDQTDQDSLPPYDVLDDILQRFIEKQQSDDDIIAAGFDEIIVRKVLRLVLLNEYKRRQSAPGPRVSNKAFGRDRRYPISSGWR
ncbi:MAG: NAD+ synthase, partial [Dokdonella sp.]